MSHADFRERLRALAGDTGQDPSGFLEGLSPIHDDWHSENVRSYGFLLFHTRVVRYFSTIVNASLPQQQRIAPFSAQELQAMNAQPFSGVNPETVDTLAELTTFSNSLESWHNTAHMRIGTATGTPMMDPRQNIFFRPFWQLHLYIDRLFQQALARYGDRQHPGQFVTVPAVAGHIESRHHGWVARI